MNIRTKRPVVLTLFSIVVVDRDAERNDVAGAGCESAPSLLPSKSPTSFTLVGIFFPPTEWQLQHSSEIIAFCPVPRYVVL
jgi:hypothetical protein